MLKVNSKKVIRTLSNRSFHANRSRNLIAVLAIALTAVLFTALFTVGSGMIENFQRQTMRQAGGDGMGVLKYLTDEEYMNIKGHQLIKEISYNRILCDGIDNDGLIKRHGELYYMDDVGIKLGFCEPTDGHKPEAANEIMMDTKTIQLLGMKQEVGCPVTLKLVVHGKTVERDFVLSGWWKAEPVFNVSIMVTSRAYVDEHIDELYNSYYKDNDLTGAINSYVMFHNSFGLESKVERIITESGYSMNEKEPNFIASNVNWSYVSSNFDLDISTVAGILAALLLMIMTGYLIIYNIFQISVIKDIRFYGLLKTIGTTGRQIKRIIRRQALALSCIGIPIGLIAGYFIGCTIVPMIMDQSYYAASSYKTSANPLIFIGSTIFALITVSISTAKPGHAAAKVSPVEAVRYTETTAVKKKRRKTRFGAKITGMAAANLGRNKKRTVLAVLSMALSLVLFNTVYTFSLGFDMDKFLSKFVDTDFLIAHADYFNYQYSDAENGMTERMIAAVEAQPGFEEGGRIWADIHGAECFRVQPKTNAQAKYMSNYDNDGNIFCAVYGLENLPLNRLQVLEGEIDIDKLKSGEYILEGVQLEDDGRPVLETSHYDIGETVILHNYRGTGNSAGENAFMTYEYKLMAKVAVNSANSCGQGFDYSFYLPDDVYKRMTAIPGIMSYVYNVSDGDEAAMEAFLKNYTENAEPVMHYSSKRTRAAEFEGMRNMILMVGGMLSIILGLIGVLNFINSMLTSILTRKREFAMLQSIGMTAKQLRQMLIIEGVYYTAAAGITAFVLGVLMSATIVQTIAQNLWFFSYQFTMLPLMITIPILLLIGVIIPTPVLTSVEKQSIVERLRESEN